MFAVLLCLWLESGVEDAANFPPHQKFALARLGRHVRMPQFATPTKCCRSSHCTGPQHGVSRTLGTENAPRIAINQIYSIWCMSTRTNNDRITHPRDGQCHRSINPSRPTHLPRPQRYSPNTPSITKSSAALRSATESIGTRPSRCSLNTHHTHHPRAPAPPTNTAHTLHNLTHTWTAIFDYERRYHPLAIPHAKCATGRCTAIEPRNAHW